MEKKYVVISKYNGYVSVSLLNSGIKYIWNSINDKQELNIEQLKQILNTPGGREILENKVTIQDKEAIEELGLNVEPEYYYSERDVEDLLKDGSLEQLQDAIEFAPEGTVSLIIETATKIKLEDRNKIKTIKDMTGADVASMIDISADSLKEEKETGDHARRAAVYKEEATEETAPPVSKYKRV